jgi:hypothetical protein
MAFYQQSKTAKAAVIGTIMPWTGSANTVPDGWVLCNGGSVAANEFPLLAQAIGDSYNQGNSDFGGNFPAYTGSITIPDLNNKVLIDIEESYFNTKQNGGTGKAIDTDPDARTLLSPLIGDNTDNGVTIIFTDVFVDVVFTLNDRSGYFGKISGNTWVPGDGAKTLYVGPRKLGRQHVTGHGHAGSYRTLRNNDIAKPGRGVIPYTSVTYTFYFSTYDTSGSGTDEYFYYGWADGASFGDDAASGQTTRRPGIYFGSDGNQFPFGTDYDSPNAGIPGAESFRAWTTHSPRSGFGQGPDGRVVAKVLSEAPPINVTPKRVVKTPISREYLERPAVGLSKFIDSNREYNYAIGGGSFSIPTGFQNYYADSTRTFDTLSSTDAIDENDPKIEAHTHDEIEIIYDGSAVRARSSIVSQVNIPATTLPDNTANRNALQIDLNVSQPLLTCIYIIRAY